MRWFPDLKDGDVVVLDAWGIKTADVVCDVKAKTFRVGDTVFSREHGFRLGDEGKDYGLRACRAAPEDLARAHRHELRRRARVLLSKHPLHDMDDRELEQLTALLEGMRKEVAK